MRWRASKTRGDSMKNSSGAIGAAKAPPYLVSHRRIINVIRIMYPRNSDQQGCGGRKEGWGIAEGETRIYVVGYIAEVPVVGRERRRRWKREGEMVRVQRERRRCPHDRSPRQGRILSLLNPAAAITAVRCQAHVFCIRRFLRVL